MPKKQDCRFCTSKFWKKDMGLHTYACVREKYKDRAGCLVHFSSRDMNNNVYEMYAMIENDCTFLDIDQFLKFMWCECCGHLSKFTQMKVVNSTEAKNTTNENTTTVEETTKVENITISDEPYTDEDGNFIDPSEISKSVLLSTYNSGDYFLYEYDYGFTTDVLMGIISKNEKISKTKNIILLYRNEQPNTKCATKLCTNQTVMHHYDKSYCKPCFTKFKKTVQYENVELKISNSPRTGTCGYQNTKKHQCGIVEICYS